MDISLIRTSQAKHLFYLHLPYSWLEEWYLWNLAYFDDFRLTSLGGRLFWYHTWCVVEQVSALVNVVGSLWWLGVWCGAKNEKWMLLRIFDLGDGPSSRSWYLHPKKISSTQIWFNSLVLWVILPDKDSHVPKRTKSNRNSSPQRDYNTLRIIHARKRWYKSLYT